MTFDGFDAAPLIEGGRFSPELAAVAEPDAATLDAALREAARAERAATRAEALVLDLWVRPGGGFEILDLPARGAMSAQAWAILSGGDIQAPAPDGGKDFGLRAAYGDKPPEPKPDPKEGDDEIVVKGIGWKMMDGDGTGGMDGGWGGDDESQGQVFTRQKITHTETCSTADGAAVQIAEKIKATDDVYGPVEYHWGTAEFSTYVVRSGGRYGAYDETIYTLGAPSFNITPLPDINVIVEGLIHNHPDILGGPAVDRDARYPSNDDWDELTSLYERYSGIIPNYDPSLWIIDRDGVVREFSYSEKSQFYGDALSPDQRDAGVGLEGRERNTSCGSTSS